MLKQRELFFFFFGKTDRIWTLLAEFLISKIVLVLPKLLYQKSPPPFHPKWPLNVKIFPAFVYSLLLALILCVMSYLHLYLNLQDRVTVSVTSTGSVSVILLLRILKCQDLSSAFSDQHYTSSLFESQFTGVFKALGSNCNSTNCGGTRKKTLLFLCCTMRITSPSTLHSNCKGEMRSCV